MRRIHQWQMDSPQNDHFHIAKFMGPTWGPPGSCWPQMGPMILASRVDIASASMTWCLHESSQGSVCHSGWCVGNEIISWDWSSLPSHYCSDWCGLCNRSTFIEFYDFMKNSNSTDILFLKLLCGVLFWGNTYYVFFVQPFNRDTAGAPFIKMV